MAWVRLGRIYPYMQVDFLLLKDVAWSSTFSRKDRLACSLAVQNSTPKEQQIPRSSSRWERKDM